MQRVLTIALALFIGLTFSFDAEARRFGGGKSFGAPKHAPAQPQQRQQAQQAPRQPAAATPAAGSKMGWLGPLAGLAAGGLLASMFFGDGFEGIQFMDVLIIALLAFFLFRLARRKPTQPVLAGAGPVPTSEPMQREIPSTNNGIMGGSSAAPTQAPINAPAWFDQERFLTQAREHFLQLQQLWDANDFSQISEYLTPELLAFLQQERASLGDGYQSTYIDDLSVTLDGVDEMENSTVATLTFTGIAKTSRFDEGEFFNESWGMERQHGDNQPWLITGIRQNH